MRRKAFLQEFTYALDRLRQFPYESLKSLDELAEELLPPANYEARKILDDIWKIGIERRDGTVQPVGLQDLKVQLMYVFSQALQGSE